MKTVGPEAMGERRHHMINECRRVVRALNELVKPYPRLRRAARQAQPSCQPGRVRIPLASCLCIEPLKPLTRPEATLPPCEGERAGMGGAHTHG